MKTKPTPDELLSAIRAKCLDCCGGSRREVMACREKCALNPWRLGEKKERTKPAKGQVSLFDLMGEDETA